MLHRLHSWSFSGRGHASADNDEEGYIRLIFFIKHGYTHNGGASNHTWIRKLVRDVEVESDPLFAVGSKKL